MKKILRSIFDFFRRKTEISKKASTQRVAEQVPDDEERDFWIKLEALIAKRQEKVKGSKNKQQNKGNNHG